MQQEQQRLHAQEMAEFFDVDAGTTTMLSEDTIRSTARANEVFGRPMSDGSVPLVLLPGRSCFKPYITIPEGCYAIVRRFGADIDHPGSGSALWPSGFHVAPPWTQVSHLITKQAFVFNTPVKGCKTADNVSLTIDVALTLRIMGEKSRGEDPELVKSFVYKLTARGLAQQLKDAQEEAVRRLGRAVNHTEVYGLRSVETQTQVADVAGLKLDTDDEEGLGGKVTDAMKRQLNDQFNKYGVEITDVAITNVRLPKEFTRQMQEKTTYASIISEQKMKQENDMQLLAMREEVETARQRKHEEQLEEASEGVRLRAEKQKELDSVVANTRKMIRELKEEETAETRKIAADASLMAKRIQMEKEAILKKIESQADANIENITAECDQYVRGKKASCVVESATAQSTSQDLVSAAEGVAAPKMRAKRAYEVMRKRVGVFGRLADNKDMVISGSTGDSLLAEVLVAQRHSSVLVSVQPNGATQMQPQPLGASPMGVR